MSAILADDYFAGAGGWDLGALRLGIHARGIEKMPAARATRAANGLETIHDDVWTYQPDGTASLQITSPPCPTFSQAGKGAGRANLHHVLEAIRVGAWRSLDRLQELAERIGGEAGQLTALVLTPLHFAVTGGYDDLAWEQVPPVLPVWQACARELRAEGFNVWTGYVHSEQYAVPQTRKRAALIASRTRPVWHPVPTHSKFHQRTPERLDHGVLPWVSMAQALGWGLVRRPSYTINGGGTRASHSGHEWGSASVRNAMLDMAEGGDPQVWQPNDLVGFPRIADSDDVVVIDGKEYRARDLRGACYPAQALTEKARSWVRFRESVAAEMSRNDSIRVTVAEAGVLQSFPYDYGWCGPNTKKYLQAGNAVPPGMAAPILAVATGMAEPPVSEDVALF